MGCCPGRSDSSSFSRGAELRSKVLEFLFERVKLSDAASHAPNMFVQDGVHVCVVLARGVSQAQQQADLVQGHVQATAIANELEALKMFVFV